MLHNHPRYHGQDKVANCDDLVEHGDEGFAKRKSIDLWHSSPPCTRFIRKIIGVTSTTDSTTQQNQ
jgi:site-specific DNA-cytosine methylase